MSASFYDLLKYAATGIASPSMTYYDRMRASTLMGAVQTLTGIPPLSFTGNGKPLISWIMKGNGQQTGSPTPDAPIMPTFCGVRNGNLWNEDYTGISGSLKYVPVYVGDGSFTLSTSCTAIEGAAALFLLAGNVQSGASTVSNGVSKNRPITVTSSDGYVTVVYRCVSYAAGIADPRDEQTMLNSGSTALPYEPYGYKIPITCAGQTVPVYLGQVSTVRRIKKLVLTGEEAFTYESANQRFLLTVSGIKSQGLRKTPLFCTHYTVIDDGRAIADVPHDSVYTGAGSPQSVYIYFYTADYTSTTGFKAYLAQQYANGTPVTVWYILDEPTTGIVNEPLVKIGDYADELHSEDAAVTIPTARGQNVLTVGTDLQPSEMSITGHIKAI